MGVSTACQPGKRLTQTVATVQSAGASLLRGPLKHRASSDYKFCALMFMVQPHFIAENLISSTFADVSISWSAAERSQVLSRFQGASSGVAARRQAAAAHSQAARERKVTLMRKYRKGELPDVQLISLASFLGPLGEPPLHAALHDITYITQCYITNFGHQKSRQKGVKQCLERRTPCTLSTTGWAAAHPLLQMQGLVISRHTTRLHSRSQHLFLRYKLLGIGRKPLN